MSDSIKETCKEVLLEIVEAIDDEIGGPLMDIKYVDELEKTFISYIVDALWWYDAIDVDLPWSA